MSRDTVSNYRQVRLILSPWEGDWQRAYWSIHFLSVRQGVPRSEVAEDGLLIIGKDVPTRADFYRSLVDLLKTLS
jgi:hypothetical protein